MKSSQFSWVIRIAIVFATFFTFRSSAQADSIKVQAILDECEVLRFTDPDTTFLLANEALSISRMANYGYGITKSFYYLADVGLAQSDISQAIDYIDSTLYNADRYKLPKLRVDATNLKGILYSDLSQYEKSIELYNEAKQMAAEIGYKRGENIAESNIGVSNYLKGDYTAALGNFMYNTDYFLATGDTMNYLTCLGNVCSIYNELERHEESLEMLDEGLTIAKLDPKFRFQFTELLSQKAVELFDLERYKESEKIYLEVIKIKRDELGDWRGVSRMYNNLAAICIRTNRMDEAIKLSNRSIAIVDSLGYSSDVAYYNKSMAQFLQKAGNYKMARDYITKSIEVNQEIGALHALMDAYLIMAELSFQLGDYKAAYENEANFVELKDSLDRVESENTIEEMTVLHQLDKKQLENDKLKEENEKERLSNLLKDERHSRDQAQKIYLVFGLALVLILALFVLRAYRAKKKSNAIISDQKQQIEEQHLLLEESFTEIKDSIHYAQRIQKAILPSPAIWKNHMAHSFVLYLPKDVVAGDFYWMEKTGDSLLFAAADCTGHGVPGAMVSVVCHNALNRAVREFGLTEPGPLLDKVTDLVIETFEKGDADVKDGMDIALCSLRMRNENEEKETHSHSASHSVLKYAGAHNPLWLIREGELPGHQPNMTKDGLCLYELAADKQPIGKYADRKPFRTAQLELKKGDRIYISSDGYPDQFGGERGKKMKTKTFKSLLLEICQKDIDRQKKELAASFEEWRGNFEQLDDVCVIGLEII